MKTAQLIVANAASPSEAMDDAESTTINRMHNNTADLLKYVFADASVLVFRGCEYFGFDLNDAETIRAYARWVATDDVSECLFIALMIAKANQ
jgi:hypothetical protein